MNWEEYKKQMEEEREHHLRFRERMNRWSCYVGTLMMLFVAACMTYAYFVQGKADVFQPMIYFWIGSGVSVWLWMRTRRNDRKIAEMERKAGAK
jgi:amino acid permease